MKRAHARARKVVGVYRQNVQRSAPSGTFGAKLYAGELAKTGVASKRMQALLAQLAASARTADREYERSLTLVKRLQAEVAKLTEEGK